ncbi:MAG: motility protein A [Spirochaetes bacterium]|nr:motility protein A [Spirochaetota bacterium]
MDLGSIIAIPLGFGLIIASILTSGNSLLIYYDLNAIFITVFGSFAGLILAVDLGTVRKFGMYMGLCYRKPKSNIAELIRQLVTFSEKSRREGLLSLEDEADNITDDFFRQGIKLVVDGTDPEVIKNILYNQLNQMNERHEIGISMFEQWGKLAPAFGMIGTLYGLVAMLSSLGDPSQIGKGMAVALITTLYGAILANLIFVPVANKLSIRDKAETQEKEIILEGILSIQSGDNPRVVEEKLLAFVPPKERDTVKQASD